MSNLDIFFLSGKAITQFIAHNVNVKFNEKDIPFATDIDFITNRFWFKLKKGLSVTKETPKSFDIANKARIILSSQINNSVALKFNDFTLQYKQGKVTQDAMVEVNNSLRERTSNPEDIGIEDLNNALSFLNETNMDAYFREKALTQSRLDEGERAKKELKRRDFIDLRNKKNILKRNIHLQYSTIMGIISSVVIILGCGFVLSFWWLVEGNDTKLTIISTAVTCFSFLFPLMKFKVLKERFKVSLQISICENC